MPPGKVAIAITLPLAILAGTCADDAPNKVFTSGRTWPGTDSSGVAALPQLLAWPGSGVHARFSGSASVRVLLNGSLAALPDGSAWVAEAASTLLATKWGSARFRFELDGRAVAEGAVSPEQPELVWEHVGLDLGEHRQGWAWEGHMQESCLRCCRAGAACSALQVDAVSIYRHAGAHVLSITLLSEASFGAAVLQSIALGDEGRRVLHRMHSTPGSQACPARRLANTASSLPRTLQCTLHCTLHCRFLPPGPPPHLDPSRRILFLGDSFVVG